MLLAAIICFILLRAITSLADFTDDVVVVDVVAAVVISIHSSTFVFAFISLVCTMYFFFWIHTTFLDFYFWVYTMNG